MKIKRAIKPFVGLSVLAVSIISNVYAAGNNFICPPRAEIQSTDFTTPSIWVAPPVANSATGMVGVGLGGKEVGELIGSEPATVSHHKGWVCIYKSTGGLSLSESQAKIRKLVESNPFLRERYLDKLNEEFNRLEPFLKKYPQNNGVGFVGYQEEEFVK